jgi:large subunit ribosomal protein L18
MANTKEQARKRRKISIRRRVKGSSEQPRLTVFRSSRHIYAQVIDDEANKVLASASTMGKAEREETTGLNKMDQAKKIGTTVAQRCKATGVEKVVFDRNGYRYHGRVVALATAARKAGLKF